MPEIEVGPTTDLREDGEPIVVRAEGRELVVVRWKGEIFAIRNVCPHQSASLAKGAVHDRVVQGDRLGELNVDESEPLVRCPFHGWDFSLRSGYCVVDPKLRVKTYKTTIRNSRVFVEVGRGA